MFAARESIALFATPISFFQLGDEAASLNAALCRRIDDESGQLLSVPRGEHAGGWQSDSGFFDRDETTRTLRQIVASSILELHPSNAHIQGMHLSAWANRLEANATLSAHTHSGAWSGAYYPDAGSSGAAEGGLLVLRDPRAGAHAVESDTNRFESACAWEWTPASSTLIVFPAYLLHWVTPYRGARPRYSVAFNVW